MFFYRGGRRQLSLTGLRISQRSHPDIPKGDWPVVPLKHQRIHRRFRYIHVGAGGTVHLDVLLNGLPIVDDFQEARVLNLFAGLEPGSAEPHVKALPFAGSAGRVHLGSGAAHGLLVDPAVVDRSGVDGPEPGFSVAVENLHFVQAVKIDTGVGALRDHPFDVQLDIAQLVIRYEIGRFTIRSVDYDLAGARLREQLFRIRLDAVHGSRGEPCARLPVARVPTLQPFAIELPPTTLLQPRRFQASDPVWWEILRRLRDRGTCQYRRKENESHPAISSNSTLRLVEAQAHAHRQNRIV